jgi:SAM-dependent methyltransferase
MNDTGASVRSRSDSARVLPRRKKPTVPFFWPEWIIQREIAAEAHKALQEIGRGRILDVGCGEKPYEIYRTSMATEWIGLDVPENPAADAHGYAEVLPFGGESFDTVICTEVLEHVSEPALVLREISRVLKPGGHVFLTTPFYWPLHEEPYDFFRFTPHGLRHLFERAGLEIIRMQPMAVGFRVVALAINTCFNNFGKHLPGGTTPAVKALFIPIYVATNLIACAMSALFPSTNNAVGTAVVARKRPTGEGAVPAEARAS